jgi:hypothetical protein
MTQPGSGPQGTGVDVGGGGGTVGDPVGTDEGEAVGSGDATGMAVGVGESASAMPVGPAATTTAVAEGKDSGAGSSYRNIPQLSTPKLDRARIRNVKTDRFK